MPYVAFADMTCGCHPVEAGLEVCRVHDHAAQMRTALARVLTWVPVGTMKDGVRKLLELTDGG